MLFDSKFEKSRACPARTRPGPFLDWTRKNGPGPKNAPPGAIRSEFVGGRLTPGLNGPSAGRTKPADPRPSKFLAHGRPRGMRKAKRPLERPAAAAPKTVRLKRLNGVGKAKAKNHRRGRFPSSAPAGHLLPRGEGKNKGRFLDHIAVSQEEKEKIKGSFAITSRPPMRRRENLGKTREKDNFRR